MVMRGHGDEGYGGEGGHGDEGGMVVRGAW